MSEHVGCIAQNTNQPIPEWNNDVAVTRTASGKIAVHSIILFRAEGADESNPLRYFDATDGDIWVAADRQLTRWSGSAPRGDGGYDKTDFAIRYTDGEVYNGKIDLQQGADNSLVSHMKSYIPIRAGRKKPRWMDDAKYETMMRLYWQESAPDFAHFMDTYDLAEFAYSRSQ